MSESRLLLKTIINEIQDQLNYFEEHQDWIIHKSIQENKSVIKVIFMENTTTPLLSFECKYPRGKVNRDERTDWERKAAKAIASEAKRLFKEPKSIDKYGNPTQRTWAEAFKDALENDKIKEYVRLETLKNNGGDTLDSTNFSSHIIV